MYLKEKIIEGNGENSRWDRLGLTKSCPEIKPIAIFFFQDFNERLNRYHLSFEIM
jgi:hypothetical protein